MKTAKLIINGKEIEIQINEEQLKQLCPQKKKTGYERVNTYEGYYRVVANDCVIQTTELDNDYDDKCYELCNYYSSKQVAKNNVRADRLMRQLRRFAVEHREKPIDWKCIAVKKYRITYDYDAFEFNVYSSNNTYTFGSIYFDSMEIAKLAIDTFKDELLWYFTEYQDSL